MMETLDMKHSSVVAGDMEEICSKLGKKVDDFAGKTVLLTGGAGFLGYYFLNFFKAVNEKKLARKCRVICMDNFIRGVPAWLEELKGDVDLVKGDIVTFDVNTLPLADYIIHAASIASPTFYRKFPIETMDANVIGLRNLLDHGVRSKSVKSFLFFSSSEIYGDPDPANIPTREEYRGNVSCTGPRACYDESKRYGETLCVNFHKAYGMPVKMARPFNNYGPGLAINDKRVIPDFCSNIFKGEDITMLSDGSPKRTFCYISDAISGYLLALLSEHNGEPFNIGNESPEISMRDLADRLIRHADAELGIKGLKTVFKKSGDSAYLTDNPVRRVPNIDKARTLLGFEPTVGIDEGLKRTLLWYAGNR